MLFSQKMLGRKPSTWLVNDGIGSALVTKNSDPACPRAERWFLRPLGFTIRHTCGRSFPSRRAAFYYFRSGGEIFKTNPQYAVVGGRRQTKRSR